MSMFFSIAYRTASSIGRSTRGPGVVKGGRALVGAWPPAACSGWGCPACACAISARTCSWLTSCAAAWCVATKTRPAAASRCAVLLTKASRELCELEVCLSSAVRIVLPPFGLAPREHGVELGALIRRQQPMHLVQHDRSPGGQVGACLFRLSDLSGHDADVRGAFLDE